MPVRTAHTDCASTVLPPLLHSGACCAGAAPVQTSAKQKSSSPAKSSPGKSPRTRGRRAAAKLPPLSAAAPHQHKRLMLEPSTPPVCNCSELLLRLQTTINDPPSYHASDAESPGPDHHDAERERRGRSSRLKLKTESLLVAVSTASFDEAIVIDSNSDDDLSSSETRPEPAESSRTLEVQEPRNDDFRHCDDSESPRKPIDIVAEPLDIAVKVSLPLPKKFATKECQNPKQQNSRKSHRSKLSLNSRRLKKAVGTTRTDQEISTCDSEMVQSPGVSDKLAEQELHAVFESVLPELTDCHSDEQRTIFAEADADGIPEAVEHEQSLYDVSVLVQPDITSLLQSPPDESDVLREKAQHSPIAALDVEPTEMTTVDSHLPDEFVQSVPRALRKKTAAGAPPDPVEEDSQRSDAATMNIAVEQEKCGTSEKTPTEMDTSDAEVIRSSETAAADAEVFAREDCSSPPLFDDEPSAEPQTACAELISQEHVDASFALPTASNENDSCDAHLDHENVSPKSCVRLRLIKRSRLSSPPGSESVIKKARKVKRSPLSSLRYKRPATFSTRNKFKKPPRVRKRRTVLYECVQPQTENAVVLSCVDDSSSTNTASAEEILIPAESDLSVQKDAEMEHVLPSGKQDTVAAETLCPAAESSCPVDDHHRQRAASDVEDLTEADKACRELSLAEDRQEETTHVVATHLPVAVSPTHTDDGELAEFSAAASSESVFSPPAADWSKEARSRDHHEPLAYSDIALANRLRGMCVLVLRRNGASTDDYRS